METEIKTSPDNTEWPGPEIVRPLRGRMVAGVALAAANRFGVPEWLIRLGFVATAFVGGLGVVLYLVGWALTPSEGETETPAARFFSRATTPKAWVGIALIAVATLVLLDMFTYVSSGLAWAAAILVVGVLLYAGAIPTDGPRSGGPPRPAAVSLADEDHAGDGSGTGAPGTPPPPTRSPSPASPRRPTRERSLLGRLTMGGVFVALGSLAAYDVLPRTRFDPTLRHYVALAAVVVGGALLIGALWGRARWLILLGAMLVSFLALIVVTGWNWDGHRSYILPMTFDAVSSHYGVDTGELMIDLTELPWDGHEIDLQVDVVLGVVRVVVPDGVGITGSASADLGRLENYPSGYFAGLVNPRMDIDLPGSDGVVRLNAHVGVGLVAVDRVRVPSEEES